MAASRDASSNAQHPSPGKPCGTITATPKGQIPHHVNGPAPAPALLAAKASFSGAESSTASLINGDAKRNTVLASNGEILLLALCKIVGFFRA